MAEPRLMYPVLLSILAAVLTLALKGIACLLTHSVALFSDAGESVINLVAAVVAYFSLRFAAKPVDSTHTYGHEKIEFFSSGLEGILILIAAVGIAWYAVTRMLNPQPLEALGWGTGFLVAATAINLGAGQVLLRVGRATESIVLEADGRHLMTDVWSSFAVLVGWALVRWTGILALDAVVALVVATSFIWTGYDLMRRSFNGLMDHALPEGEQAAVRSAIESRLEPGMTFHALRTRRAGSQRFADFHLLVPGAMTVQRAHALTGRIEEAVRAVLPAIEITVHIEPIEERAAWEDSALLPIEQAARRTQHTPGDEPAPNS